MCMYVHYATLYSQMNNLVILYMLSKLQNKPVPMNKKQVQVFLPNIIENIDPLLNRADLLALIKRPKVVTKVVDKTVDKVTVKKRTKKVVEIEPDRVVETALVNRLPAPKPTILIKPSSYYANDREIFINFINSTFEPYKKEIKALSTAISCNSIGSSNNSFDLLVHQKIVRDYLNIYSPYRGLLLYHGLGSGKTCTSIAIAEGMKEHKQVIVLTPASLQANYVAELKKCGDLIYNKMQLWEWYPLKSPIADQARVILHLSTAFVKKQKGVFFINPQKTANAPPLGDEQQKLLDNQINEMIANKYSFINYNGVRAKRIADMTSNYTVNIFDGKTVIIDEAHNFVSRIVNKLKAEKPIKSDERGVKERMPVHLSVKLYELLLSATNCKIVLLSGTPVINYPNEFAILFNMLRGYIKTYTLPVTIETTAKVNTEVIRELLGDEKELNYVDYSSSKKTITITRNPFGFDNKITKTHEYRGVVSRSESEGADNDFEASIISKLKSAHINVDKRKMTITYLKALPDELDEFIGRYVDMDNVLLKNVNALKRRIVGLSSYFKSAHESLLPTYNNRIGDDYHIVRIPMSDYQFKRYEQFRKEERKMEKPGKKKGKQEGDVFDAKSSTYRIFSRLVCNYTIPDRPVPTVSVELKEKKGADDLMEERVGEVEGDETLNELGGVQYATQLKNKLKEMEETPDEYFSHTALETYSPKFLAILTNIQDPHNSGNHLVYSQFRTAEGIGLFAITLESNGFTRLSITKGGVNDGVWTFTNTDFLTKPAFALYTGTETTEEKEIMRRIYNGEWDDIPISLSSVLRERFANNNNGEVVKVFMITSSGSEGINLRNTRFVHIMEPYWHSVRSEQVIGRARRICSHANLPRELQTVTVFVYLMTFSTHQLESDNAIELKKKDLSKSKPPKPITSDQFLFEIAEIKAKLIEQMTTIIKETAFDCYLYGGKNCFNFNSNNPNAFAYVPNYENEQNDVMVSANKNVLTWKGKTIKLDGVEYVYRDMGEGKYEIYDKESYLNAVETGANPLHIANAVKSASGNITLEYI